MYRQIGNQGKCKLPLALKLTLLNLIFERRDVYDCSEIIYHKK